MCRGSKIPNSEHAYTQNLHWKGSQTRARRLELCLWDVINFLSTNSTLTHQVPYDMATANPPSLLPLFPYPSLRSTGPPSFPQAHPAYFCPLAHLDFLCMETLAHICIWRLLHVLLSHLFSVASGIHHPK